MIPDSEQAVKSLVFEKCADCLKISSQNRNNAFIGSDWVFKKPILNLSAGFCIWQQNGQRQQVASNIADCEGQ